MKEIQQNFQDSLDNWADIMLNLQVKNLNSVMRYSYDDLMNMLLLFQEVTHNIAYYKNGGLGEDKELQRAEQFGKDMRRLITDFCGIDPHDYFKN